MNIFILDSDPVIAAQMQCDKHVVKMTLESAQLLCTAHQILDGPSPNLYKPTHKNHPCAIWVRKSHSNYLWLYRHFIALATEYTYRYGKVHLCEQKFREVLKTPPKAIAFGELTPFAQCVEEKIPDNPILAYRNYYNAKDIDKRWTKREKPEWAT